MDYLAEMPRKQGHGSTEFIFHSVWNLRIQAQTVLTLLSCHGYCWFSQKEGIIWLLPLEK